MIHVLRNIQLGHGLSDFRRRERSKRALNVELCTDGGLEQVFRTGINSLDLDVEENRYLLSSDSKGTIAIYDLSQRLDQLVDQPTFTPVAVVDNTFAGAHKFSIECVQWYPHDTGMFLTSSADQTLKVWDTNALQVAEQFDFHKVIYSHHMSAQAKKHTLVAVSSEDARIYLCDLRSGSKSHTLRGHQSAVLAVKWSPRNQHIIATGSRDCHLKIWDIRRAKSCMLELSQNDKKKKKKSVYPAHFGSVNSLCFTGDGLHLMSYGMDNCVMKWDLFSAQNTKLDFGQNENPGKKCIQMGLSDNLDRDVLFVPSGGDILIRDLQSGKLLQTLQGHLKSVICCQYSNLFQELYSGSADTQLLSWKVKPPLCGNHGDDIKQLSEEQKKAYQDEWSSDEEED